MSSVWALDLDAVVVYGGDAVQEGIQPGGLLREDVGAAAREEDGHLEQRRGAGAIEAGGGFLAERRGDREEEPE